MFAAKMKRHADLHEIAGAIVGMCLILLFVTPIVNMGQHAFEKWSPDSWWFEYESIVPVHAEFEKDQPIEFISTAEYKRTLKVQWFDTLWCDTGTQVRRLETQITPNQPTIKYPGFVGMPTGDDSYPTWEYNEEPVPEDAIACRMNSYIEATTPLGYKKTDFVGVDWFQVNK